MNIETEVITFCMLKNQNGQKEVRYSETDKYFV